MSYDFFLPTGNSHKNGSTSDGLDEIVTDIDADEDMGMHLNAISVSTNLLFTYYLLVSQISIFIHQIKPVNRASNVCWNSVANYSN